MGLTAADCITDPKCRCAPLDSHRIGRNLIVVSQAMKSLLGKAGIWKFAELDRDLAEPSASVDLPSTGLHQAGR